MSTVTPEHKQIVLAHLNDIAPDTFNEGSFHRWRFWGLKREADQWRVNFSNSSHEGDEGDGVSFEHAGDCVDADGGIHAEWFEALNAAILRWEGAQGDGGYGDDEGDGED